MAKEYEIYIGYLEGKEKEIDEGIEMVIEVRDVDTYERKIVKGIISKCKDTSVGDDKLWIMNWLENREPEPWSIKIIEELEDDVKASRSDVDEDDLNRLSQESKKYASGKYGGDGLSAGPGMEEISKYVDHALGKSKSTK